MDQELKLEIMEQFPFPHIWILIQQPLFKCFKIVLRKFFPKTPLTIKR